jgi:predicted metal-dependent phosphoesterase TrpH
MATWRLRVDLHTHTSYSDGLDSPTRLVAKAAQQGLHSIAITDHDILAALPEAQQAGCDCGVEVLVGVELTVQYQQYDDIHLLGYFFDPTHTPLQEQLALAQQYRLQRGMAMLERINALLIQDGKTPLDKAHVLQSARGALTRPHLAHALIARGYASNVLYPLLDAFKAMGLVGLEVYHHCHYPDTLALFQNCATRYGLVATGGSDYHGRPEGAVLGQISPGYAVPDHVLPDLQRAHAARVG